MIDLSQFRNISFNKNLECAICHRPLESPVIQLPKFPLSEIYVDKKVKENIGFVDQNFHLCPYCGHGQLSNIVDPKIIYSETNFFFRTSTSITARKSTDFFLDFIHKIVKRKKFSSIIEIGCNDLHLLRSLKNHANHLIGIDPILKGKENEISDENITIIGNFIENIDLSELSNRKPALILSSFTLEHMENPREVFELLFDNFDDETIYIFQFPALEPLIDNYRFDQISHQHLQYFSLKSFIYLLNELNGELIEFKLNPHHWGSILVAFKKRSKNDLINWKQKFSNNIRNIDQNYILSRYETFKAQMKIVKEHLESIHNQKIYGYGAALMLPVLAYFLENDLSCLECVIDDDTSKQGMYYVNLPIKICPLNKTLDLQKSIIFITAIDNESLILPKAINLNPIKIILPLHFIS